MSLCTHLKLETAAQVQSHQRIETQVEKAGIRVDPPGFQMQYFGDGTTNDFLDLRVLLARRQIAKTIGKTRAFRTALIDWNLEQGVQHRPEESVYHPGTRRPVAGINQRGGFTGRKSL